MDPAENAAQAEQRTLERAIADERARIFGDRPPVEPRKVSDKTVEGATRDLLLALGLDPESEGLRDTPRRVSRWWAEFMHAPQNGALDTAFEAERHDELVLVRGIEVWSVCEHHLLPFRLKMAVGYITAESMLGLSKLARCAFEAARGPNVQERITARTADLLGAAASSPDVAVIAEGEHLCMSMRGVHQSAATTTTSVMRGRFRDDPRARAEFLALAGYGR